MQLLIDNGRRRKGDNSALGFSLAEALIATAVLGICVMACFSAIMFNRVSSVKAKEEAIVMDFMIHYLELARGIPFISLVEGQPINYLYNGANSAPSIIIPTNGVWTAINTSDFTTFHPDLVWLKNRNPQMRTTITT
jgi:hypothetical protein